jgi:arginine-tRNA-protein transferase
MRTDPPEGVLIDATPHGCPYLPGRTAVLPTRWYGQDIRPADFDALLACADRRVGRTLYRPECPSCNECQGIRISTSAIEFSKSQRRAWRRNADVRVTVGSPVVDKTRLDLFNRHKLERGLSKRRASADHYYSWLASSCVRTVETRYWLKDALIGVGIIDVGLRAASSVYFYFDPDHAGRSLGTYSVLREANWLKGRGIQWYYLGLYVRECSHLSYKSRFLPHERLIDGEWRPFVRG